MAMRERGHGQIAVLDAPSNLGLRPPEEGAIPGCYKLPWALRDRGLLSRLRARDLGSVVPPRYLSQWSAGQGDRNAERIAQYSVQLADRLTPRASAREPTLVLGGDCSILIGSMLALRRVGRCGLVFIDAHSDFRHPGNAPAVGAAAGEDLAIVTGRGDHRLVNLDGSRPYVRDDDVHLVGVRPNDECLDELRGLHIGVTTSEDLARDGAPPAARRALDTVQSRTTGFWVHVDADVIDSSEMPAVDSPEPQGPSAAMLSDLLSELRSAPGFLGMELTIYDPDLDPDGRQAALLVECLSRALGEPEGSRPLPEDRHPRASKRHRAPDPVRQRTI